MNRTAEYFETSSKKGHCVQKAIIGLIEPVAWKRCEVVNRAEQESLRTILQKWKGAR